MDQQTYMKKFSRLVRWRLPKQEADAVVSDYAEMVSQAVAEKGEAYIRDLGEPAQAAQMLTERKAYVRWLAAFLVLAVCLLAPEALLLRASFYRQPLVSMAVCLVLGMVVSIALFHRRRESGAARLPKGLLLSLLGLGITLAAVGAVLGSLAWGAWKHWPLEWYGPTAMWALRLAGTAAAAAGLIGLVQARIRDRRWSALYVMALTLLALYVLAAAFLMRLDIPQASLWEQNAAAWGLFGAAGLAATGVLLC